MALALPKYSSQHRLYLLLSVGLWIAVGVCSALLFWLGPANIPVWYSLVQPEEQLAPSWAVASLPILSTVFLFFGFLFGRKTDLEHELYLASVNWWSQVLLQSLLLLSVIRILKVVL